MARTTGGEAGARAASDKDQHRARVAGGTTAALARAAPEPREDLDGQFQLARGTLARQWLAQAGIELALGLPDEPLILLEKEPQPGVVVLAEEVGHERAPGDAIVEQRLG